MQAKIIKNHRIPPLFYEKNYYKQRLAVAMLGLIGGLVFLVKFVCSGYYDNITFTQRDLLGLAVALSLFGTLLPCALVLYVSSTLIEIIESIVNDNQSEEKS